MERDSVATISSRMDGVALFDDEKALPAVGMPGPCTLEHLYKLCGQSEVRFWGVGDGVGGVCCVFPHKLIFCRLAVWTRCGR